MRFFYDTEFIEDGRTIELVSIGVVSEDGREFYAVSTEFDPHRAGAWVREHVLGQLPSPADPAWRSRDRIREDLLAFLTGAGLTGAGPTGSGPTGAGPTARGSRDPIELWAWIAAYDHVALAQLWGDMRVLPRAIPRFTHELKQRWEDCGSPPLPAAPPDAHDALADARWNLARWTAMEQHRPAS